MGVMRPGAEQPPPAAAAQTQPSGPPTGETAADRQARATAVGRVSPPWWCFEGTIGSLPTGWCAQTADACKTEAQSFAKTEQAKVTRGCESQPLAACVSATKVLKSTSQIDCFASFAGCDAMRTHLLGSSDYSGVTACEGTPTPWVTPKSIVSPF